MTAIQGLDHSTSDDGAMKDPAGVSRVPRPSSSSETFFYISIRTRRRVPLLGMNRSCLYLRRCLQTAQRDFARTSGGYFTRHIPV